MAAPERRWLRYTADRRSIVFAAVHFALMGTAYAVAPHGIAAIVAIAAVTFSAFVQLISTHNAMHSPPFVQRWANRVWQIVLSLTFAYPASVMVPVHNLSHHLHLQTPKDVLRTTDLRHRWNLLNLLRHVVVGTVHVHVLNAAYARRMRKRRPKWFAQVCLELAVVLSVAVTLAYFDLRGFLEFVLLPSVLGESVIIGLGFLQHDGTDPDTEYDHSRNFVSPILNYLLFDNGYHAIHHIRPGLHWSLCKKAHEEVVVPHIAPTLNQRSILLYILRTCVLPRGRVRYDGRPVTFDSTPPGRRELWLPGGADVVGASSGAVEG